MDGFKPAIHNTGYPLPEEYDELEQNPDKVELSTDKMYEMKVNKLAESNRAKPPA